MTPFVIWLDKEELDDLISVLLHSKNPKEVNNELLTGDELLELTHNVIKQNNKLINFFQKLEPFDLIQRDKAKDLSNKQKCEYYRQNFKKMTTHCSIYNGNNDALNKRRSYTCDDCPLNSPN